MEMRPKNLCVCVCGLAACPERSRGKSPGKNRMNDCIKKGKDGQEILRREYRDVKGVVVSSSPLGDWTIAQFNTLADSLSDAFPAVDSSLLGW